MSIELFFFSLLFFTYFRSDDPRVVSITSGGCNQSSSALFYVVLESLCRCVNARKSSSSFFYWLIVSQRHLWDEKSYASSLVFLFSGPFVWVLLWSSTRMDPSILRWGQSSYLSLSQGSWYIVLFRVVFWDTLSYFFSFPFVWWYQLLIFPSIFRFPFLRAFWFLLDLLIRLLTSCVVCRFSLLAWRILLCQISFLYLDCIFSQSSLGFSILFRFWQTVWYSCTSSGWSFLAIY